MNLVGLQALVLSNGSSCFELMLDDPSVKGWFVHILIYKSLFFIWIFRLINGLSSTNYFLRINIMNIALILYKT